VLLAQCGNNNANANYATAVGLGENPQMLDNSFYIFYTKYPTNGEGWNGATVNRFKVTCQ
jgi:hypothetical protein